MGLAPIWGMSVRLPERVGRSMAKELMYTSRRISGAQAAAIGLVDRCVADDDLDVTVAALVAEILANSWGTNRIDKDLVADASRRCSSSAPCRTARQPIRKNGCAAAVADSDRINASSVDELEGCTVHRC